VTILSECRIKTRSIFWYLTSQTARTIRCCIRRRC